MVPSTLRVTMIFRRDDDALTAIRVLSSISAAAS